MSLFGGTSNAKTKTAASGIALSSSVYGAAVPIIYGSQRCSGNLLWYGDFVATPQNTGGGKGGGPGGKAGGSTSYTYSAYLAMALCEGPVAVPYAAARFWANKTEYSWAYALAHNISSKSGANGQSPWGYLTTNHPTQAIGYSGLAYAYFQPADFGTSAQIQNYSFEVGGFGSGVLGTPDTDPAFVVSDLLTNADYGVGFPSARVTSLTTFSNYCKASGMLVSVKLDTQQDAATTLNDIVQQCNSEFVWSGGQLTIVPYGDQTLSVTYSGTTYTYTPPSAALYSLTDDDFINTGSGDPVQRQRARPSDRMNSVKLEWLNRSNQYAAEIVEVKDQSAIELYGLRASSSKSAHIFTTLTAATMSATLQLQRQAIRNQYTFTLGWRYCLLDPMDIVEITDLALGLNQQWVRILSIEENDTGDLAITAEEYLGGSGGAPLYAFQTGNPYIANYNSAPGPVNAPIILEPPIALFVGEPNVTIGVSGASANWGGCDVWMSVDGTNYEQVGRIGKAANMGVTTAALPLVADTDTSSVLTVDLTESFGSLPAPSTLTADNFTTSAWICNTDYSNGEMVGIGYDVLSGTNTYELTGSLSTHTPKYLRRGQLGTAVAAHASGSLFMLLDQNVFNFPLLSQLVGVTLHFKFTSFNIFGAAEESLSTVTDYTYVPFSLGGGGGGGSVSPPTGISIGYANSVNGSGVIAYGMDIDWTASPTAGITGYELQWRTPGHGGATTGTWDHSVALAPTATSYTLALKDAATTYDVQIRAILAVGSAGSIYSTWASDPACLNFSGSSSVGITPSMPVVTATADFEASILTWTVTSTPDLNYFDVAYSTSAGTTSTPPGGYSRMSPAPGFDQRGTTVGGLQPDVLYYFWVRGVNSSGQAGSWSTRVSAITLVVPDPTGIGVTTGIFQHDDGTITAYLDVSWTSAALPAGYTEIGIGFYEIEYQNVTAGGPWVSILLPDSNPAPSTLHSHRITPVVNGPTLQAYSVRVRAVRATGFGPLYSGFDTLSGTINAAIKTSGPSTPSGVAVTGAYAGVIVSWNKPNASDILDVAYYQLWAHGWPGSGAHDTFSTAVLVADHILANYILWTGPPILPPGGLFNPSDPTHTYWLDVWVVAVNRSGQASTTPSASMGIGRGSAFDNSALVPGAATVVGTSHVTSTFTGGASAANVMSITFTLLSDSYVVVSANIAQTYSAAKTWGFGIYNGGTNLAIAGSLSVASLELSPNVIWASPSIVAAGTYTYTAKWLGQDNTMTVSAGFMAVEALQK